MKKLAKIFILIGAIVFAEPKIFAQVSLRVSVRIAPPPLPVYVQPECPADGYLWEPGYWAYDNRDGYYWVPGVWVAPPRYGLLWTPSYWGFDNGYYHYHQGYWGPHVGFYGGINYGYGYPGEGFYGGNWSGRSFRYNTAVFNVNRTVVRNVYVDRSVVRNMGSNRVSFNGPGGVNRRPNAREQRFTAERHVQPTRPQLSHQQVAAKNPEQHFATNHGRPATPAMNRVNEHANQPGRMQNRGAVPNRNINQQQRMQQQRPEQQQRQQQQQQRPEQTRQRQQPRMEQPRQQQQARPQQQPRMEQQRPQQQRGEMHPPGGGEHSGGGPPQGEQQQQRPQQPQQQQPRPQQQPQQGPPAGNQHPPGGGEHSGGRRPPQ